MVARLEFQATNVSADLYFYSNFSADGHLNMYKYSSYIIR